MTTKTPPCATPTAPPFAVGTVLRYTGPDLAFEQHRVGGLTLRMAALAHGTMVVVARVHEGQPGGNEMWNEEGKMYEGAEEKSESKRRPMLSEPIDGFSVIADMEGKGIRGRFIKERDRAHWDVVAEVGGNLQTTR